MLNIHSALGGFTVDVIASTGFGMDINSMKDQNNEFVKHATVLFENFTTTPLIIIGGKQRTGRIKFSKTHAGTFNYAKQKRSTEGCSKFKGP